MWSQKLHILVLLYLIYTIYLNIDNGEKEKLFK